jgi:hypothetical protein
MLRRNTVATLCRAEGSGKLEVGKEVTLGWSKPIPRGGPDGGVSPPR